MKAPTKGSLLLLLCAVARSSVPEAAASAAVPETYARAEVEIGATGEQTGGNGTGTADDAAATTTNSAEPCSVLTAAARADFRLALHRNGEPEACGTGTASRAALDTALRALGLCHHDGGLDKFRLEAALTELLAAALAPAAACGAPDNATAPVGPYGYCDMGPDRTVVQEDHHLLVRTAGGTLPCRFYTREGLRITKLEDLAAAAVAEAEAETDADAPPLVHLYAVPAGRVFMFAPRHVGEEFVVAHAGAPGEAPIVLETLSLSPRVFEIHNFYTAAEADALIAKTLNETSEVMGLHRSTTGSSRAVVNSKRTSENAWDQAGETAVALKQRCMQTLGFDEYREQLTDGLQILRYRNNQAYNSHPDYLSDSKDYWYNYDSAGTGGNRFATILLYMSDVDERDGGQTMFTNAWPHDAPEEITSLTFAQEVEIFRATEDAALFERGSWEESLTAMCRTRLSVKPKKGKAVLFYSQLPDGREDKAAIHAACPVMRNSTKWAANLWVWSGPRAESPLAPKKFDKPENDASQPKQVQASFYNSKKDPAMENAELFWGDSSFWAKLGPGAASGANTFVGHEWTIKVDGKIVKRFTISDEEQQVYHI